MGDDAAFQEGTVSGQQDAPLSEADINQGLVVGITRPHHVKPEQSQQPRQSTEVDVDDETRIAQRHWTQPGGRSDVDRFEHRVRGDAVAGSRAVREVLGIPIHHDEVHLGMRNAHRLENVFDCLMSSERAADGQTTRLRSQEIVELGVRPDIHVVLPFLIVSRGIASPHTRWSTTSS